MKTRNSVLYALGLAAAITLGGAVSANAQAKKTTTKKKTVKRAQPAQAIPVTKGPTVAKVDTVIVTRVDTVTLRRIDTVTTTTLRTDTVTRMVYPPLAKLPGLFFGIGAGAEIPMNDIRGVVKDSWGLQGQVGYFPGASPLGIRADATYGQLGARKTDCATCSSPKVWTIGGDVILRMPLDRTSKINPVIYVFGGGGWNDFSSVDNRQTTALNSLTCTAAQNPCFKNGGKAYWDVGPGVDFSLGGLHLYAEGKYMTILADGKNLHMFPVFGGIKLY
jgi:hypothetical protein